MKTKRLHICLIMLIFVGLINQALAGSLMLCADINAADINTEVNKAATEKDPQTSNQAPQASSFIDNQNAETMLEFSAIKEGKNASAMPCHQSGNQNGDQSSQNSFQNLTETHQCGVSCQACVSCSSIIRFEALINTSLKFQSIFQTASTEDLPNPFITLPYRPPIHSFLV